MELMVTTNDYEGKARYQHRKRWRLQLPCSRYQDSPARAAWQAYYMACPVLLEAASTRCRNDCCKPLAVVPADIGPMPEEVLMPGHGCLVCVTCVRPSAILGHWHACQGVCWPTFVLHWFRPGLPHEPPQAPCANNHPWWTEGWTPADRNTVLVGQAHTHGMFAHALVLIGCNTLADALPNAQRTLCAGRHGACVRVTVCFGHNRTSYWS